MEKSDPCGSSVIQITESNIDSVLDSNEVVFILFYGEYAYTCRHTRLMPTLFENAAKEIAKARLGPGKIAMCKFLLDHENGVTVKTRLTDLPLIYYPCFKLFRNAWPSKNGYLGRPTPEALAEFIKEQLTDPIIPFSDLNELRDLDQDLGHVSARLQSRDQPAYEVLRKVATSLKEEYRFHVKFGDSPLHCMGQLRVVFRSTAGTPVEHETYDGSLLSFDDIFSWVRRTCFPLLRELTPDMEEGVRNWGLFFILIHMPSDTQSLKTYKQSIRSLPERERRQFRFVIADGNRLRHVLASFGKLPSDLPLIALNWHGRVILFDFSVKFNVIINEVNTSGDLYYKGVYFSRLMEDSTEEYHISGLFE